MNRLFQLVGRAAMASPGEWRCRANQALFTGRNCVNSWCGGSALARRGHQLALKLRDGDLPGWWKSRRHTWFVDVHRDFALQRAAACADSQIPWVLGQADLIVAGKMPLFSHPPVEFAGKNRWHHDFVLQRTAPRKFYGTLRYLDANQVGDSKHVWEPNRFAWALWLGVAHRITSDPKYTEAFIELADDWFAENPYPIGINYCSALEVAFRTYAWLWSLDLFADALAKQPELLDKLLHGIWVGCRHIESNLSTYFSPNTHLLGEAFALYACGAAIPEFLHSPRWRRTGLTILAREAKRQFFDDGTHRELSSGYHIYATDLYLQACLIGMQTGYLVNDRIFLAARQFALRLAELAPPSLLLPMINDCDGGRLTCLVSNELDALPSLQAAQALNLDLPLVDKSVPMRGFPLLMSSRSRDVPSTGRLAPSIRAPLRQNVAGLFDSGLVAHSNRAGDYLLFRATPFGYRDCPHSHDAPLGIVLHLAGQPVFIDNGVGSYTQDKARRDLFRSALGKNTVLLGETGPSIPGDWFSWRKTTDCRLLSVTRFADGIRVRGKHTGFSDLPERHVVIQREVVLLDAGVVAIVDRWDADAEVSIQSRFTLHPETRMDAAEQMLRLPEGSPAIHFLAASLDGAAKPRMIRDQIPYSANYGRESLANSLAFTMEGVRRGGIVTLLSRIGQIRHASDNVYQVGGDGRIQLRIAAAGIEPRKLVADENHNNALREKVSVM